MTELWYWIGFELPDRPCKGTYSIYDYTSLPQIEINTKFKDIKTLADLKKNLEWLSSECNSPTACYFDVDTKTGIFYRDQQDCVLWALDENTGYVCTRDPFTSSIQCYVAKSLPEFLSRIFMENKLWYESFRTKLSTKKIK